MGEERAALVRGGRRKMLYAVTGALLTIAAAAIGIVVPESSGGTGNALVRLSATPLGVNVGPWDHAYAATTAVDGSLNVMQSLLEAAGIDQFRYGGGSYADRYDWQTNTNINNCPPNSATASFTASCAQTASLSFSQFSRQARAIGADSFVTVNYGSGTPAEAAAWVAAARSPGESVALWEVGNESYGCWEVNNELSGPPTDYRGYKPPSPKKAKPNLTCPRITEGKAAGTQTLATSYAFNAQQFLRAMKAANPAARIGVPWAFDGSVPGAAVPDNSEWNDTVLKADGKYASFVDAHYYPFGFSGWTGGKNPTDEQVLRALWKIPALYKAIRAELNIYDPSASVLVGETAVSNRPTMTNCTPVGALFAAGDVLSWLAAGAQSVDWWDLNDSGNTTVRCVNPDYGLFTSSSPTALETPYYGYLLASVLARPHALLGTLSTSDPSEVLAFQSALPDGKHAVAFINTSTESARTVTFQPPTAFSGMLRTWSYAAGKHDIVVKTASAASVANGIVLPAESMLVLETQ